MPYELIDEAPAGRYEVLPPATPKPNYSVQGEGWDKIQNYSGKDSVAGAVRGAGSIGSTLMAPIDAGLRAIGLGNVPFLGANDRRSQLDPALKSMGANPDSNQYQAAKLAAEVAGTSGMGGLLGQAISKIPGAAAALPTLLPAIRSGGMAANGAKGAEGLIARAAGGAVNGAATAGLVNPADADTGMMISSTVPVLAKGVALAGGLMPKVRPTLNATNAEKLKTAKESMDAGYIIPPSMIDPSFKNKTLESISGKHGTAQMASTQNQAVTENLARKALGLPADAPLNFATMQSYRSAQHQAGYEPLRQVGAIPAGQKFDQALTDIVNQYQGKGTIPALAKGKQEITDLVESYRSKGFDAGDAVDAIRVLREDSSALYKSAAASDKAKAKATRSIADAFEGAIDDALSTSGQKDLLAAYRAARENIAKSGSVEKAIREGSGTLDARKLAAELQKGKFLSGDLKTIAKFGNVFDKAAQPPHLIGSPDVHNLRAAFSTGAGAGGAGLGALIGGPIGAAVGGATAAAYPYVVPPMARSIMFRKGAQRSLLDAPQGPGALRGLLTDARDEGLPLLYRSGGLLGGN